MYREKAGKYYLVLAKCRKSGAKKIRKAIKIQMQYISRDLGYIANLLGNIGVVLFIRPALEIRGLLRRD